MPPVVWALVAVAALVLVGLCVATGYAVLRARSRARIRRWPISLVAALVVTSAVPWLVVWLAPIAIRVNIHTFPALLGWLALALLAFGLLVLLPLAAVLCVGVWWTARRRIDEPARQNDENGV